MGEFSKYPPKVGEEDWNALVDHALEKPCSFIIRRKNSTYEAIYGSGADQAGKIAFRGADVSTVIQSAIDALTGGGTVFLKEIQLPGTITYGDSILIIEDYKGERTVYSNLGKWRLPQLTTDPDTTGWGIAEKGRWWFNTGVNKIKIWDGSKIVTIPAAGVGGAGMASGKVEIDATTVGMKTGIVTFPIPFASPPTIQTSIEDPTPPTVDWGRVFAKNVTTTQFEYEVEIMLAQPGGKVYLVWQTQV